jgi:hypothetical protein
LSSPAAGWTWQLRVTPLAPAAYIVLKMLTSLILAGATVFPPLTRRPDPQVVAVLTEPGSRPTCT